MTSPVIKYDAELTIAPPKKVKIKCMIWNRGLTIIKTIFCYNRPKRTVDIFEQLILVLSHGCYAKQPIASVAFMVSSISQQQISSS